MKKMSYAWWIVIACGLIGFLKGGIVSYGFTALFEPLVHEFGWSYTEISFAKSLRGMEMSIFAPFVGFLIDRVGTRKLLLLGIITVGFGLTLLSITQSLVMFYLSFLFLAFGAGGVGGVVLTTTVASWFENNMGKALGVLTCLSAAGGLLIPLVVWLIDVYQWRTALVILGLGICITGIPLALSIREKKDRDKSEVTLLNHALPSPENVGTVTEMGFKEAIKHRVYFYLNFIEFIRHMITSAIVLHIMPYLSSVNVPKSAAVLVTVSFPIFNIAGRFGFGWFADVSDQRKTMILTLALMGLGLLGLCYARQTWTLLIFSFLFSMGWGGGVILTRTMQREYFGMNSFGKMLGIIMGLGSLGGVLGPTLAGWIFDTMRSYYIMWLIFFGLCLLSIGLILTMKPAIERNPETIF